ncbi:RIBONUCLEASE 1, ribonuclease 1 [Hibiscus trionum]|uniref:RIBONUCLEASE 1, ribonuclease 1 n=1 Tax=Hibiscus trionum TaxID=183268 RepID=A0A9W7JFK9_HIBTR|nr:RIBONUCLEASE 1, ribonuclease 1 [Hibiscus trionum]
MVMKLLLLAFAAAVVWSSALVSAQPNFQFYKLSLQWPNSICLQAQCITPVPNLFTIHGLWPTFGNDAPVLPYHPHNNRCFNNPRSPAQAMAAVAPIVAGLNAKWPTLQMPGHNPTFWQIEWRRHGMCSDYGANPLNYFTVALNLANNNAYDPFTAMGVQPSNTPHRVGTLLANVRAHLGVDPQIACWWIGNQRYLAEFRLCFARATPPVQLQNCPNTLDRACTNPNQYVLIP